MGVCGVLLVCTAHQVCPVPGAQEQARAEKQAAPFSQAQRGPRRRPRPCQSLPGSRWREGQRPPPPGHGRGAHRELCPTQSRVCANQEQGLGVVGLMVGGLHVCVSVSMDDREHG